VIDIKWKPVVGYEGIYEVSEFGDVRSLDRTETQPDKERCGVFVKSFDRFRAGTCLKKNIRSKGRECVELHKNNGECGNRVSVYKIVYAAFIGDIHKGNIIHHKDGDVGNNHYTNLEQMTLLEHNRIHAHASWNKGKKNPASMVQNAVAAREKTHIPKCLDAYILKKEGKKISEISFVLGICERSVLSRIKRYKEFLCQMNPCRVSEIEQRAMFHVPEM